MLEMLRQAAAEQVLMLLRHSDPGIRLQAAIMILELTEGLEEPAQEITIDIDRSELIRQLASAGITEVETPVDGFDGEEGLNEQQQADVVPITPGSTSDPKEIEQRLAAAQVARDVPVEEMPPGFQSGESGIGSGTPRRRGGKRRR